MSIEFPLRQLWKVAFQDDDDFLDKFFSTAYAPERCRYILEEGQLAAALYWLNCRCGSKKYAYIYAVATDPAFRGRGLCRRLMATTHRELKELGYTGAILVPGEPGLFTMYEKMGYTPFSGMDSFTCVPGDPVTVKKASIQEYAAARQKLLPMGGVVQENENLHFLASYAHLYTGDDFALAAVTDGDKLLGLELLGNADAAPGITAAFGCAEGRFRIPGSNPFAMYLGFTRAPAPGYFGLAFD